MVIAYGLMALTVLSSLSAKKVVVGVMSALLARRLTEEPGRDAPEAEVLRTCESLMSAYVEDWNATKNGTEAWSWLLEEVVGAALVPGTIAAAAARALGESTGAAWMSTASWFEPPKRKERTFPEWATIVGTTGPRFAPRRWAEDCAVRFVRGLLTTHDVTGSELRKDEIKARVRHLRRTTEALGFCQNLVAPVFIRGKLGQRGGVKRREKITIRSSQTETRCVWFEPVGCDRKRGTLVYMHGGGFLIGSANCNGEMVARIAEAVGLRTLLVEYRKSPESQFPGALIDALHAVRHVLLLLDQESDSSKRRPKLVLGGDSAGGTLAFATLLALKRIDVTPRCVLLISPLVDLDFHSDEQDHDDLLPRRPAPGPASASSERREQPPSKPTNEGEDVSSLEEQLGEEEKKEPLSSAALSSKNNNKHSIRELYSPRASTASSSNSIMASLFPLSSTFAAWRYAALLSPKAVSKRELAKIADTPLCVHVGGRELLCDSICQWADKAKSAGATVDLTVFKDEVHAFHAFGFSPAWEHAKNDLRDFVARHLDDDTDESQDDTHKELSPLSDRQRPSRTWGASLGRLSRRPPPPKM